MTGLEPAIHSTVFVHALWLIQLAYTAMWSRLFYFCAAQEVARGNHQNSRRLVLDQFGYSVEYPFSLVPVMCVVEL